MFAIGGKKYQKKVILNYKVLENLRFFEQRPFLFLNLLLLVSSVNHRRNWINPFASIRLTCNFADVHVSGDDYIFRYQPPPMLCARRRQIRNILIALAFTKSEKFSAHHTYLSMYLGPLVTKNKPIIFSMEAYSKY